MSTMAPHGEKLSFKSKKNNKMEDKYDISDFSGSDDDDDEGVLKETIAAVRKLDRFKQVPPAERSEPSLQVDEFHLLKERDGENAVNLNELTQTLTKKTKHAKIARDLKSAQRLTKTLPKPLEKPEAERVSRRVGFEKVKTQLTHWDPIVQQNRVAEHQVFPLPKPQDSDITTIDFVNTIQPETDLEKRMAEILKKNNPDSEQNEEESSLFHLTLEEMIERRKEAARLRAQQSYMVAKAHRQNKIKSKTYHRIARRERIRQQMKEFETLQQTNPEEALKRIEELEKERALERVTLRHRNTGKWAKNQAVRAKYNKESREVLSEQLKLSRDLTKKVAIDSESSGEDEEVDGIETVSSDNPWVAGTKTEAEVDDFISGYRKFWDNKQKLGEEKEIVAEAAHEDAPEIPKAAQEAYEKQGKTDVEVSNGRNGEDDSSCDFGEEGDTSSDKDVGKAQPVEDAQARGNVSNAVKSKSFERAGGCAKDAKEKAQPTDKKKQVIPKQSEFGKREKKAIGINSKATKRVGVSDKNAESKAQPTNNGKPASVQKREVAKSKNNAEKRNSIELIETPKSMEETSKDNSSVKRQSSKSVETEHVSNGGVENISRKKRDVVTGNVKAKGGFSRVKYVASKSGKWAVTETQGPVIMAKKKQPWVNALFNKMDQKLKEKAEVKVQELKRALDVPEPSGKRSKNSRRKKRKLEAAEKSTTSTVTELRNARLQRPDTDAPLDEGTGNGKKNSPSAKITSFVDNLSEAAAEKLDSLLEVDPNNFIKTVKTQLQTAVPDFANGDEAMDDDDDEENADGNAESNQLTISEAFADDDVVAEFEQEKQEEIDKNKPQDIDLSLPGWGSWGGHQIKPNERKRKRFLIEAPKPAKRRDENKGHVYINEKQEEKVKSQQVTELPFPFKSVKDFEASVRAPISNTFIPESAHRKLTLPRVITKTGAIIEPLSRDVLADKRKSKMKKLQERKKRGEMIKAAIAKTRKSSK